MKLPRFPPKLFPWDEFLPHLPEVDIEPEALKFKTPILDLECKIHSENKK